MGGFQWQRTYNRHYDSMVDCKSQGIRDENHKKVHKIAGSVTYHGQAVAYTGLYGSRYQPDLGSGSFSPRRDGKLPGQAIIP